MIGRILSWIGGVGIGKIGEQLRLAYDAKLKAQNDHERIEAEKRISELQAQQAVLVAEQGSWMTRWIRPALALPVAIYVWKIIVWDTVLKWGVTPDPGEFVNWIVVTVIAAYFLTRPFERRR